MWHQQGSKAIPTCIKSSWNLWVIDWPTLWKIRRSVYTSFVSAAEIKFMKCYPEDWTNKSICKNSIRTLQVPGTVYLILLFSRILIWCSMVRMARVVVPGHPHHMARRGRGISFSIHQRGTRLWCMSWADRSSSGWKLLCGKSGAGFGPPLTLGIAWAEKAVGCEFDILSPEFENRAHRGLTWKLPRRGKVV